MIVTPSNWMNPHVIVSFGLPSNFYLVLDIDEGGAAGQLFMPGNKGSIYSEEIADIALWLAAAGRAGRMSDSGGSE